MGSLGPNSGVTFSSDATLGVVAISNPANAGTSDNSYATSVLLLGQSSNFLNATNFGFSIPLDSTITGIMVEIERSATVLSALFDNSVKIIKSGSIVGNEKANASAWPTADAYQAYGADGDLWGVSWTPTDINSTAFGLVVSAISSVAATAQIDHIRITIYYLGSNQPGNIERSLRAGDGISTSGSAS